MENLKKGFALIEWLVVVAIIVILTAVTQDYTRALKVTATKTIHKKTIDYILAETQKCGLGEATIFGAQSCPATPSKAVIGVISQLKDKNPFITDNSAIKRSINYVVGQISLSVSGLKVIVRTCSNIGCAKNDKVERGIKVN
tara:strand:- start:96 stop:521 length:426 start_codon:yes stop_codon:yes gene_type:complete